MRVSTVLAVALTAGSAVAGPAQAARAIAYDCAVQANQPDHGLTHWRRRIIVEAPPARQVRILDDFGQGLTPRAVYSWISASPRRIVLENGAGKVSYIDRINGDYILRNDARKFMIRGRCRSAGSGMQ